MCNECYDNSYLDYPVYGETVQVGNNREFSDKAEKIWQALVGDPPGEDESIYEYLVKNENRPSAPFKVGAVVDMGGLVILAAVFGIRDSLRLIAKKLGEVYMHPRYIVYQEAIVY